MKTVETNKLIAEFMGYEIIYRPYSEGFIEISDTESMNVEDLAYDKDWDRLMTVVDKIDSIEVNGDTFAIDMYQTGCQVFRYSTYNGEIITTEGINRLDATYKAVVEFIEWYMDIETNIIFDCPNCGCNLTVLIEDSEEIRECEGCGTEWEQSTGVITLDVNEL